MSLCEEDVANYLAEVKSLKAIDNHEVRDSDGFKTGQMPKTISLGKQLIDEIIEDDNEEERMSQEERDALILLREALDTLPVSLGYNAIMSVMQGLNSIQKNLLGAVSQYLANIGEFEVHKPLLKAVVLVLKILEYDLIKKEGPITRGIGWFQVTILSDAERVENHAIVKKLLNGIIEKFDSYYEPSQNFEC